METANENSSWRYNNKREIIVRIDVDLIKSKYPELADSAYDLTNDRNRNHFLKTIKQIKFSAAYSEVVFKDMIPREAVSLEYVRGIGTVRNTTAQPQSFSTVTPKNPHTIPPVCQEPYAADRSMPITKLPNTARGLGTEELHRENTLEHAVTSHIKTIPLMYCLITSLLLVVRCSLIGLIKG